jgi:hypothetical protein
MTLVIALSIQYVRAPPKMAFEYSTAAASTSPLPPIRV